MVPVVALENVRPHPNADKLELANVLGYQMVIPKGKYHTGDVVVYFPADVLLPDKWAEKFGVKSFLRGKDQDRVGKIRLRGEPSFGLVANIPPAESWSVGDNVAEFFGCTKYYPPVRATAGDAAAYDEEIDPFIMRYTDIQNGRMLTDACYQEDAVVVTEKIHGTNCKIGSVDGHQVAGPMSVRRQCPCERDAMDPAVRANNTYWSPSAGPG